MRFMMLMIPKVYQDPAYDDMPSAEAVGEMMKFNVAMSNAGVMLAGEGLHPLSKGARVTYSGGQPAVTDGAGVKATDVLGGYWMIQVKSLEEALEWATRCPAADGDTIELRQVQEMEDFSDDIQALVKPLVDKGF